MFPWYYFILVLLQVLILGVWVWRWRRNKIKAALANTKEQHAYCASCGYDLTGHEVDSIEQVASPSCPECGRHIATSNDIVIPKRVDKHLSNRSFAIAVFSQLFVVALFGWMFFNRLQNPPYQPQTTAALMQQVFPTSQSNPSSSDVYELDRRFHNGGLSTSEKQQLINEAMKYQANPSKTWDTVIGSWIEEGRALGQVNDQQWQQYTNQTGFIWLNCRAQIHPGDPMVLEIDRDTRRLRTSYMYRDDMWSASVSDVTVRLYPDRAGPDANPILTQRIERNSYYGYEFVPLVENEPLSPGKYKAVLEANLNWPDPATKSTTPQPIQISAPFEIRPRDAPLLIPVQDEALASKLKNTIFQELLRSGGTKARSFASGMSLSVSMKDPPSSVAGCYDVSLMLDGYIYTTSWFFEPNNAGNTWRELTFLLPDHLLHDTAQPFDHFTLRLTPNPEHAKQLPSGYEYLDHTIWLRDIPMGLPNP